MRNLQFGRSNDFVTDQKYIYVYYSRMIYSSSLFVQFYPVCGPPHLYLHGLTLVQNVHGLKVQVITHGGVDEIRAVEAFRFALVQTGKGHMRAETGVKKRDRPCDIRPTVAKIRT